MTRAFRVGAWLSALVLAAAGLFAAGRFGYLWRRGRLGGWINN